MTTTTNLIRLLQLLAVLDETNTPAKNLRAKLLAAITLATHECPDKGLCTVCGAVREFADNVRKRRAQDLKRRLAQSDSLTDRLRLADKARKARSNPTLKFVGARKYTSRTDGGAE